MPVYHVGCPNTTNDTAPAMDLVQADIVHERDLDEKGNMLEDAVKLKTPELSTHYECSCGLHIAIVI